MRSVDLRSDTVTLPTPGMMEAIVTAPLGDDVYKEDPTVIRLEEMAARKLGKERALLVTSGTQGNLVCAVSHLRHGNEVILESESHIYYYEVGGISAIAGAIPRPIKGEHGALDPVDVEKAIRVKDIHQPETRLICMENTHNRAGGSVITPTQIESVADIAARYGIPMHLDGARIFNAAIALDVDPSEIAKPFDSIQFCLSKGLAAPVGSLVVGSEEFIEKARRIRKMLGGGMRQAGIIAAPGIIALEKMIPRLKEDHDNAKILAKKLSEIEGITIDAAHVETNIVIFDVKDLKTTSQEFIDQLKKKSLKAANYGRTLVRLVTHYDITREDIEYACEVFEQVAKQAAKYA